MSVLTPDTGTRARRLGGAVVRHSATPGVVFAILLLFGLGVTFATAMVQREAGRLRLNRLADAVAGALEDRIGQHLALLDGAVGYWRAVGGAVDGEGFRTFVASLDLDERYGGIQAIGYAPLLPAADAPLAEAAILRSYGAPVPVHPPSAEPSIAPVLMIEPGDARNRAALGYDMFAEARRRQAITAARDSGQAQATAPLLLEQEITADKQAGVLVYLPVRKPPPDTSVPGGPVIGFVYAAFRAGDLHRAALSGLQADIATIDPAAPDLPVFGTPITGRPVALRSVTIASRRWDVQVAEPVRAGSLMRSDAAPTLIVALISLLLAGAVAELMRGSRRQLELAEAAAAQRSLLLAEMDHRIKNHIARIGAIVRNSAREAASLPEFVSVFEGRVRAMAAAQDLVSRSPEGAVPLRPLLERELAQLLPAEDIAAALHGPDLSLRAEEGRALGLIAHELATNALKYGSPAKDGLSVRWTVHGGAGADRRLSLTWTERDVIVPAVEGRAGFGSALIRSLVEDELGGTKVRSFTPEGMTVAIDIPLRLHD